MSDFDQVLNQELAAIRERDLYRQCRRIDSPQQPRIRMNGREFLNFSSNDYLGLANDARVKEGAIRAIERFGAGSGASRLICGSLGAHDELEQALGAFKRAPAALSFSSGYAAAVGTICALIGKHDVVVLDRLVHACIVDAARLSGAKIRVFAHNDLNDLERILAWANSHGAEAASAPPSDSRRARVLVVTESIFSMDGDQAPLREMVELKEKYGAWLMLDEAHATGLYGRAGRGLADAFNIGDRIEVQMGTLGKALGASGGYICGSRALVDLLINRARSFIFSTAPVPAAAGAAAAALRLAQDNVGEELRRELWARVAQVRAGSLPFSPAPGTSVDPQGTAAAQNPDATSKSAIIPLIVGAEADALRMASLLLDQGFFVPAIRYPTVARGQARLRLTVTASHSKADIEQLLAALPRV